MYNSSLELLICNFIIISTDGLVFNSVLFFCLILFFENVEYDDDDNPREETIKPMVDGGTEGFKGHARVIMPGVTPCFECTIWLFPPQVKFPLCTLAETPRTAAHCIEYAHLIKWDEVSNTHFLCHLVTYLYTPFSFSRVVRWN